jgi:hypothetical protein
MEKNKTEERKKTIRISTSLRAQYFFKDEQQEAMECTVINISLSGVGLAFYTPEKIDVGSLLFLKIFAIGGKTTITVEGIIKWVNQGKKDFLCGVKLTEALDEVKLVMLGLF